MNGATLDELDTVYERKKIGESTIQGIIANIYKTVDEK
jgi:hypothetical protein